MTSPQTTNVPSVAWKNAVIVGLGATGFSVARYLFGRGMHVTVAECIGGRRTGGFCARDRYSDR